MTEQNFFKLTTGNAIESAGIDHLILETPSDTLKTFDIEIVDTPGVNSNNPAHTAKTLEILPELHAAIFLINAKKPGSRSTSEFINKAKPQIEKIFWSVTKSNAVTERNIARILDKLPQKLEKDTGVIVENLFALGFQEGDEHKKLVGVERFLTILTDFMVTEWENVVSAKVLEAFEEQKLSVKEELETNLKKMEEAFYKMYGSKPIGFFDASDLILEQMKNLIPSLLNETKTSAMKFASDQSKTLKNKYYLLIDDAWFKTTLGIKIQALPRDVQRLQKQFSLKLENFLNYLFRRASEVFFDQIKEQISALDNFKEKIYWHMSRSIKNRVFYTLAPSFVVALAALAGIYFASPYIPGNIFLISKPLMMGLMFMTTFGGLLALAVFCKPYARFFIKLFEKKNFELRKLTNFYDFLTNRNLTDMGASKIFIERIQKNLGIGGAGAVVAGTNNHPLVAIGSLAVSFVANEFSGGSLDDEKRKIKQQIQEVCDNLNQAYEKTFDNLKTPMVQALEIMIDMIQNKYKDVLLKDIQARREEYLQAREPVDRLETFIYDYGSIVDVKNKKETPKFS